LASKLQPDLSYKNYVNASANLVGKGISDILENVIFKTNEIIGYALSGRKTTNT